MRSTRQALKGFGLHLRRKSLKLCRALRTPGVHKSVYVFAIVCVKRAEYVRMAIDNINSLLYLNAGHSFVIYADALCRAEYARLEKRLDYPECVECVDAFGGASRPWQHYKVEALIDASRNGRVLTDADGLWHDDPVLDRDMPTMLVSAYPIKDNRVETLIVSRLFPGYGAIRFDHYVSGLVSIPSRFMTEALAEDIRRCTDILLSHPLEFLGSDTERENTRRLAEELGVNIALQHAYKGRIAVLKQSDGPKDRTQLQSLYYGCHNHILE